MKNRNSVSAILFVGLLILMSGLAPACTGATKEAADTATESPRPSESTENEAPEGQVSYPRIIADSSRESMPKRMFQPAESRTLTLNDGTRIRGTTGDDYLMIDYTLPNGDSGHHRLDRELEVNYGIYPMGKHLLVVHGVNAGPSGAGTVFNIRTGERKDIEIYTAMYTDGKPEPMEMSLYAMSLIELSPGVYALAGTGNDALLKVDGNVWPLKIRQFRFPHVPLDDRFETQIRSGKIWYRHRPYYPEDTPWKEFRAPAGLTN